MLFLVSQSDGAPSSSAASAVALLPMVASRRVLVLLQNVA